MKQLLCGREFEGVYREVQACKAKLGHDGPCTGRHRPRKDCFNLTKAMEGRRTFECEDTDDALAALNWAREGDTVVVPAGTLLHGVELRAGVTVCAEGE